MSAERPSELSLAALAPDRGGLWRLFAVSFAADLQIGLVYTAVPFKALRLGAHPFELGLLAAASTGTYALLALLFGRLSDRVPRTRMARFSCAGVILACIGLTLAERLGVMLAWIPLVGGSMALFWPSVQASIRDRSDLSELPSVLGRFNLWWCLGKGTGFLAGGTLVTLAGPSATFTAASLVAFTIFLLLPESGPALGPVDALLERLRDREDTDRMADTPAPPAPVLPPDSQELDARAPLFRRMAWCANSTAYGLGATLNHHYPRLVQENGWSPRLFGLFLGLIYLTQALAFVLLRQRPEMWRFRRARLYWPQVVMMVAVLSLPLADLGRVLLAAVVFGVGLGICYYSSIYYSLHTHTGRGRNAGVHEALIGLGSMAVPLLGGILARQTGTLWMPYVAAAAAVAFSLIVQEAMYRAGTATSRRDHAARFDNSSD